MYKAVIRQSINPLNEHEISSLYDLKIDGPSVCGVDWFRQEARQASFACLADSWIDQYVLHLGDTDIIQGFAKLVFYIYKDGAVIFTGFLKPGSFQADPYLPNYQRIQFTLVDLMGLAVELAGKTQISKYTGVTYAPLSQIHITLEDVLEEAAELFDNLFYWNITSTYDATQWTPFLFTNLELFNWDDFELDTSALNPLAYWSETRRYVRLDLVGGVIYLTYVNQVRRVDSINAGPQFQLLYYELFRYHRYEVSGANLNAVSGPMYMTSLGQIEDNFDDETGLSIHSGQTAAEWIAALPNYMDTYAVPEPWEGNAGLVSGGNYYTIADGVVMFSGYTNFDEISLAADVTLSALDWIRALGQINAIAFEADGGLITIKNKLSLYETDFAAMPGTVLSLKVVSNTLADSSFEQDVSMFVNGESMTTSINFYYNALVNQHLKYMVEAEVKGYYPSVNTRYEHRGFHLYVIGTSYDHRRDVTKLTCLGYMV